MTQLQLPFSKTTLSIDMIGFGQVAGGWPAWHRGVTQTVRQAARTPAPGTCHLDVGHQRRIGVRQRCRHPSVSFAGRSEAAAIPETFALGPRRRAPPQTTSAPIRLFQQGNFRFLPYRSCTAFIIKLIQFILYLWPKARSARLGHEDRYRKIQYTSYVNINRTTHQR